VALIFFCHIAPFPTSFLEDLSKSFRNRSNPRSLIGLPSQPTLTTILGLVAKPWHSFPPQHEATTLRGDWSMGLKQASEQKLKRCDSFSFFLFNGIPFPLGDIHHRCPTPYGSRLIFFFLPSTHPLFDPEQSASAQNLPNENKGFRPPSFEVISFFQSPSPFPW